MINCPNPDALPVPWVRLCIVTYDSGVYIQRCVDALQQQTDRDFEVVILDNQSRDGSIEDLELPDDRFRIILNARNEGFATGSNRAAKGAETPYIMTLNPDTALEPDCLSILRETIESHDSPAMLSPLLWRESSGDRSVCDGAGDTLSIFGLAWRNGYGKDLDPSAYPAVLEVFGPSGAAALYRRDVFEDEDGFNDTFFCYFEDVDLAFRIRCRGGRALLVIGAQGVHTGGHSVQAVPDFPAYHTDRNRVFFLIESVPGLLLILMGPLYVLSTLWFQIRQRRDHISALRMRALRDACRQAGGAFRRRYRRKPYSFGASLRVARRMSWRPRDVRHRRFLRWDAD